MRDPDPGCKNKADPWLIWIHACRSLEWSLANAVVSDLKSYNRTAVVPVLGVEDPIHIQLYIEKYKS